MFGKKSDTSGDFYMPKIKPRDCLDMRLPNIHARPMMRIDWVEWQLKQGQDLNYWVMRFFDSQEILKPIVDIENTSIQLAIAANEADERYKPFHRSAEIREKYVFHLEPFARFGLLAGLYERFSNTTSPQKCHSLSVNAILTLTKSAPQIDFDTQADEIEPLLELTTCWAGYSSGKIPGITIKELFRKWHD